MSLLQVPMTEPEAVPVGEPLQSLEAEEAVLGAVLYNPDLLTELIPMLEVRDFTLPKHRKIWEAIVRLHNQGKAVDLVTVTEALAEDGALEEVGGPAYLARLMQKVPSTQHALAYAQVVEEMAIRRSMIAAAQRMVQLAHKRGESVEALLGETEREIFAILSRRMRRDIQPLGNILEAYYEELKALRTQTDVVGVRTGFKKLDQVLKGLQPSELIYIAGRPGMGKTAFLLTIARNAARDYKRVAIFSLEMSAEQVAQRLIAQEARVRVDILRVPGLLSPRDWSQIHIAVDNLSGFPIFVDDTPGISPVELRAKSRRIQAEYGLDLILVDYLQLMMPGKRLENRVQEVSYISSTLKHLARDLGVPVVAAAQLSRAVEQRADRRPMLSDLRESGSLEQDADVVLFLYRPEAYQDRDKRRGKKRDEGSEVQEVQFPGYTEVIIAKHRHGPTGKVPLQFRENFALFEEPPLSNVQFDEQL